MSIYRQAVINWWPGVMCRSRCPFGVRWLVFANYDWLGDSPSFSLDGIFEPRLLGIFISAYIFPLPPINPCFSGCIMYIVSVNQHEIFLLVWNYWVKLYQFITIWNDNSMDVMWKQWTQRSCTITDLTLMNLLAVMSLIQNEYLD